MCYIYGAFLCHGRRTDRASHSPLQRPSLRGRQECEGRTASKRGLNYLGLIWWMFLRSIIPCGRANVMVPLVWTRVIGKGPIQTGSSLLSSGTVVLSIDKVVDLEVARDSASECKRWDFNIIQDEDKENRKQSFTSKDLSFDRRNNCSPQHVDKLQRKHESAAMD